MKDSRERGAVMVEFAIIVPLLLVLVLGLVEFGYRYQRAAVLNNAAFIGARDFSIHGNFAQAKAAAVAANNGVAIPGFALSPASCPTDPTVSANVTVTITSVENSPTKAYFTNTFTINAKGVARCG
jgi:Flp pilus assembly protein TadG